MTIRMAAIRSIAPMLSIKSFEPTLSMPLYSVLLDPLDSSSCTTSVHVWSSSSWHYSSDSEPVKTDLTILLNYFCGMNSSRARFRRALKMMRVEGGNEISHIYIKMRNCKRFIMFHRYLSPMARKIWRMSIPRERPAIESPTSFPSFSSFASSA